MTSAFNGAVDGHIVIPGPHCGPGGTMHFNFGSTFAHDQRPKHEPFSTVPFRKDPDFVDRPDISDWIDQKCEAPASRAALVGLGGVGKSQLAIQYCHDARAAKPATWVFWVHAGTRARFEEAYRSIADRLKLPGRDDPKNNVLTLVRDWLCDESNGRWIMVLDNADDVEMFYPKRKRGHGVEEITPSLAAFVPQSHNGSILVTSRSKDVAARLVGGYKSIRDVHAMDDGQALQLLRTKLKDTSDESGIVDLIKALDRIPLAITQAAAYINCGARMTVQRYLVDFWRCDRKKSSLLNWDAGDLRRDESASNSVITTWEISFEQIREERPSAADLLSLMSFFNPQGIPESVLRAYIESSPAESIDSISMAVDDSAFEDDLGMLIAYSLVKVAVNMEVCEMHQLVQFCTQEWLSLSDQTKQWGRRFTALMARVFPSGAYENWPKCQMLLPHVEPMLEHEAVEEEMLEDWAQVLSNAGWYLWMKGQYVAAERAVVKAVQTREKRAGEKSIDTLFSVGILALVLQYQGKYEAAEEMNRRALEGYEKALGKDHPSTLTSVGNLAGVLRNQGKYEAAEEMNRRALEGYEKALGKDHPSTLTSADNLAGVLRNLGKYEAAEEMNRRALEGYEKALGKDHPSTLTSADNLAGVLRNQGKYEAAEEMNRRALEGREKALGKDHPSTLTSVGNLAGVLRNQGKYEAAEEMNRRALEGREKALGKDHPETLIAAGNLSTLLRIVGKYEESETMIQRVLQGHEKALGKDHPDTLTSVGNLASVLQYQGKYEAAEEMNRRALEGREKALGKDHPDTLTSADNLAGVLRNQGKYEAAEEMNRRALEGYEKALGKDHPDTLTSVGNLAGVLRNQGKYEAAEEMNRRALEGREKALGKDHPDTLTSVYCLAFLLHQQREYEAALPLYKRATRGYQLKLGVQHPTTIACSQHYSTLVQEIKEI